MAFGGETGEMYDQKMGNMKKREREEYSVA